MVIDSDEEGGLPLEFLQELVGRLEEEEALESAFQQAIENLSMRLSAMEMCDSYKPYLYVSILILHRNREPVALINWPGYDENCFQ